MTNKHDERVERIVVKLTRLIHPQDQGKPTSKLEDEIRETLTTHTKEVREQTLAEVREEAVAICDKWQREFNKNPEAYADIEAIGRIKNDLQALDTLENKK